MNAITTLIYLTVALGRETVELAFNDDITVFNSYLNNLTPDNRVGSSYNALVDLITPGDKDKLHQVITYKGQPNGPVVMNLLGVISEHFGAAARITVKKQPTMPTEQNQTVTGN